MYNLILADLFKIRKSMTIKVIFAITTISAVAMVMMAYLIQQGSISTSMAGIGFMFSDINVMSILGAVMAGVFICGDFDNKIIHESIANGNSRGTVIVVKIITFLCSIVVILIPYIVATVIAFGTGYKFSMGSVSIGFLNLLTVETGKVLSAVEMWKLLVVMLTLLLVYLAQMSLCIPLALALKKPVFVVAIYYGATILFAQLVGVKNFSLVIYNIFSCTPYGGKHSMVVLNTGTGEIFKTISISLLFISTMFFISYFTFRKSEIK
ncbi:ABC transporter permease [Clostridium cellulovorans]|uniref:ABC-2 family transporter protein n=1 Tax=Clostridium cellulovorans (strain ATCC 35296 / DSM 3052 / OCM 3 / 743B) TaxID=573061 RepID=D9SQC5_CLOC7|nr:ABC transporter permease [Clostridium cellulovorans]ADL50192.1 hypothetical protein Clocel_0414 [Clostridium cellulovorans 743B]